MSHPNQLAFVGKCAELLASQNRASEVAEIGACDVNGTIRNFFPDSKTYIGIDLSEGPGVDVVQSGHHFGDTGSFDLVLSSEVFEHNPFWLETFVNMIRMAKPGGCIIFTCASPGRFEHGTGRTNPADSPGTSSRGWQYYRNLTKSDFTGPLRLDYHFSSYRFYEVRSSNDLYFIGTTKLDGYDAMESSWLDKELPVIDALVAQLRRQKEPRRKARHPILAALHELPISLARWTLPDQKFQDFTIAYRRLTARRIASSRPTDGD